MNQEDVTSAKTEAAAVAMIAARSEGVIETVDPLQPTPVLILRDASDGSVDIVDLEDKEQHPRRATTTQVLHTETAFAAYTERYAVNDETAVYCDIEDLQAVAVFNDHEKATDGVRALAGWRDHRALLQFERGRAWDLWVQHDRSWLTQAEFIDLLEEGIDDVIEPQAADLLDLARNFSMHKSVAFRSQVALDSGQVQLGYEETISGAGARSGNLSVPEKIKLGLDPIKGDNPYAVSCRLRWRVTDDAKLKVCLIFDHLEEVKEQAWTAVVARITAALDQIPVLEGCP